VSKHEKTDGPWGDLTEAARALARELQRFEEQSALARRMPLDSQKAIERAAKATTETAAGQQQVDVALGALVQAITAVRVRHEANAAALQARGEEIQARAEQVGGLLERWSALGEESHRINQLVQDAAGKQREATPETMRELVAALLGIEERMSGLVEAARDLSQAATAAALTDVAEQANGLRQQVAAARNKMGLLRKSLEAQVPDVSRMN
jgi:uncharacterized protein YoxC